MTYHEKLARASHYVEVNMPETSGDVINDAANFFAANYEEYCKLYDDLTTVYNF